MVLLESSFFGAIESLRARGRASRPNPESTAPRESTAGSSAPRVGHTMAAARTHWSGFDGLAQRTQTPRHCRGASGAIVRFLDLGQRSRSTHGSYAPVLSTIAAVEAEIRVFVPTAKAGR